MSHARALLVIGGVVLSAGLLCLGWVLSPVWKYEVISLRGFPRHEVTRQDKKFDAPPEFALQPAQDTVHDAVAVAAKRMPERMIPTAETSPQPAATDHSAAEAPAESVSRETKLQLAEPRLVLQGTPAEQLEQLLEQPVTLRVSNATVDEVVAMLRGALPVNVLLDLKELYESNYDKKLLFELTTGKPLSLRLVLQQLLAQQNLDFICRNDSLIVTTVTKENGVSSFKVYEVGDLLRPPGVEHEHETVDFDSLINLIAGNVRPLAVRAHTGPPEIYPYETSDVLVIEQTRRGHEQITKLLNELRRGRGLKIPDTLKIAAPAVNLAQQQPAPQPGTAVKDEASDPDERILRFEFTDEGLKADLLKQMKPAERIEYQLRRRALLQAQNVTLLDIVQLLRDKLQINILIDKKAIEESAFDTATPIRYLPNAGTRLNGSLRQLLNELALSYCVEEESLLITTKTAQENKQYLRYYAVGEFIRPLGIPANLIQSDFDSLINLIQSTIQPTTWKANGGQGDVAPQDVLDLLIVSNTYEVHEQLDEFLAQLRKIHAAKAETVQANEAVLQRVVYQLVLPREKNIKETVDKNGQVTNREILLGELQYSMDDLVEMIKKTIEPGSWTDDKHKIDALGESLIVTHSQAAQRKLHELLHDLGITEAQHRPLQQHGYGIGAFGGGGGLGGAQNGGGPVGRPISSPPNNNPQNGVQNSGGIF